MTANKTCAALCLAALLAAGPAWSGGLFDKITGGDKPKTLVLEDGSDLPAQLVEALNDGNPFARVSIAEQKLRRVAISGFQIKFLTNTAQSSVRKNLGGGDSRAAVAYRLEGVTPEQMQALTDQARQALEQQLQARGYELVSAEELLADPDFARLASEAAQARVSDPNLLSTAGLVTVNAKGAADLFGVMGMTRVMGLSERLNALMLNVKLVLNFASLEEMGWLDRAKAGADSGVSHQVRLSIDTRQNGSGEESGLWIVSSRGLQNPYPLRRKVYLPSAFAKEVRKLESSKTEAALGFLASLAGGGSVSASYLVVAADDYAERVAHDLGLVDRLLAEALPKLK